VQLTCGHLIHGLISLTSFPFPGYLVLYAVIKKELPLIKHLRTSRFQCSLFPFFVSQFPRLIRKSASGRLKCFVVRVFFVRWYSCSALMHAVYFNPQIQNSSFILPIESAGGKVWCMNTVRGKKFFSSPYHCFGAMELTQLLL